MAKEKELYSIVIIGGMNPRIHHPSWYRFMDLISPEELEEAVVSPLTFIIPPMGQFQSSHLTVTCQEERWEIKTNDSEQVQRIIDLTSRLFDDLLPHTPVTAAGFNFHFRRETKREDVAEYLASLLVKTPLGLTSKNIASGEMTLRRNSKDNMSFVTIKSSPSASKWIHTHHNFEYKFIAPDTNPGYFKLGKIFAERFACDRSDAEEQTKRIIEAINDSIEV
ncbi:MAG: hypothetical protein U0800_21320 [Isosphaeraceae bacterium]